MSLQNTDKPILLLGAGGKTTRRVAQKLEAQNVLVRAVSRSTSLPFDWRDDATWSRVLEGVRAIYITYQPDLAIPGAVKKVDKFIHMALTKGAKRIVLLSGRGEEEALNAERALADSGADWTVVRAAWFNQNFSENFFLPEILAGHMTLPRHILDVKEPFVDANDIADVVVASLLDERHIGQIYEVTGPRLLTLEEAIREIAQAANRPIQIKGVSSQAYRELLQQQKLPADLIWLIMYLFDTVMDGRNTYMCNGVEQALGRTPTDFTDYVNDVASSGIWKTHA